MATFGIAFRHQLIDGGDDGYTRYPQFGGELAARRQFGAGRNTASQDALAQALSELNVERFAGIAVKRQTKKSCI